MVTEVPIIHMKFQINQHEMVDFPWLTTDPSVIEPAGDEATFDATMKVPAMANVGLYHAAIRVDDGMYVTSVPVVANEAAFSTKFRFGGPSEATNPYDHGLILRLRNATSYTLYRLTTADYWLAGFAPTLNVTYLMP